MDRLLRTVTLFEIEILSELGSYNSLRSICRVKQLEAPHLSKIIGRLEAKLKQSILKRSPKGYLLTPAGRGLVSGALRIIEAGNALTDGKTSESETRIITIAAPRFVSAYLLAPVLEKLRTKLSPIRFRLLEMSPLEVTPAALSSACEMVIGVGEPRLTRSWETVRLGHLSWGLFVSLKSKFPARAKESAISHPFIVPTYWSGGRFEEGDDYCPLPWRLRKKGDESSSVVTAVEILTHSNDQFLFAPHLVVQPHLRKGDIREVCIQEWDPVSRPIHLSVRSDLVSKRMESEFRDLLSRRLGAVSS